MPQNTDDEGGNLELEIEDCGIMNYLVLATFVRESFVTGTFHNFNTAYNAMYEAIANAVDYSVDALEEWFEDSDESFLGRDFAWANDAGPNAANCDWKIIKLFNNGQKNLTESEFVSMNGNASDYISAFPYLLHVTEKNIDGCGGECDI